MRKEMGLRRGKCLAGAVLMLLLLLMAGMITAQAAQTIRLSRTSVSVERGLKRELSLSSTSNVRKVKWSSADSRIATVSKSGVVKGKKVGSTRIICRVTTTDGKTYRLSCRVKVKTPTYKNVKTTKQMRAALVQKGIKTVNLKKAGKYTIPNKNYRKRTVVVYRPSTVTNKGKVKKIRFLAGAAGSVLISTKKVEVETEGNLSIVLRSGAEGTVITATTPDAQVTLENRTGRSVTVKTPQGNVTVPAGERAVVSGRSLAREAASKGNAESTRAGTAQTPQSAGISQTGQNLPGQSQKPFGQKTDIRTPAAQTPAEEKPTPDAPAQEETPAVIDRMHTGLINLGFAQYVAVTFQPGYDLSNVKVLIDGTDITRAMTPVSDDGSVAKWEVTGWNPASLVVVSAERPEISDQMKLSDNQTPVPPTVQSRTAAKSVLTYGAVAYWDYYLTNYAADGSVRIHPAKTTFSRAGQPVAKAQHPYYSPTSTTQEKVQIMFNYNTPEEAAWFDQIPAAGALELVTYDQYKNVINDHLSYEKLTEPHGSGMVGVLAIPFDQDNFRTGGRYHVRIFPEGKENRTGTLLTDVHVVSPEAPKLELSDGAELVPGKNIHFKVSGMVYGITDPIEHVYLTNPEGMTEELTFIDDYFLFGDLFVLYNDASRNDGKGVNHTRTPGIYELQIYANGFLPMTKRFEITVSAGLQMEQSDKTLDGMSSASMGSSLSGDGTASGGTMISANILFDMDLLVNAEIFDKLKLENANASAIVDRYETETTGVIAALAEGDKTFYDWNAYYNAVSDAKLNEGRYLSFADYLAGGGVKTTYQVSRVKEVLEDNLLGELQENGSFLGYAAPMLVLTNHADETAGAKGYVLEGEDAVFTLADESMFEDDLYRDYLRKVQGVYSEDSWYTPLADSFSVSEDGRSLILSAAALSGIDYGSAKLFTIRADEYKDAVVEVPYRKALEKISAVVLQDSYESGKPVQIALIHTGESETLRGDFFRSLTRISYVNGDAAGQIYSAASHGKGFTAQTNEEGDIVLTLDGSFFLLEGVYTLTLEAAYYQEQEVVPKVTVTIREAEEAEDAKAAPEVEQVEKKDGYYRITFRETENMNSREIQDYLDAIAHYALKAGDVAYVRNTMASPSSLGANEFKNDAADSYYGGAHKVLYLGTGGFSDQEATTVVIRAAGYRRLIFQVDKDGALVGGEQPGTEPEEPGDETLLEVPTLPERAASSYWGYLEISSYDSNYVNWLAKVEEVQVDDTVYQRSESYGAADGTYYTGSYTLVLPCIVNASHDKAIVKVKAEGYQELLFTMQYSNPYGYGANYLIVMGEEETGQEIETPLGINRYDTDEEDRMNDPEGLFAFDEEDPEEMLSGETYVEDASNGLMGMVPEDELAPETVPEQEGPDDDLIIG